MPTVPRLSTLARQARERDAVMLPRVEGHWLGMVVGLPSAALGVAANHSDWPMRNQLGWLALGGLMAGMLLFSLWKDVSRGWRVVFSERRVEPVGLSDDPVTLSGDGWSIACAPGDRKAHIAIDLRHVDRGRVARLFVASARRQADQRAVDELADALAGRLAVPRSGPRL